MELPELPYQVGYVRANGDRTVFAEQVYNGAEHMTILGQPVFQPVFTEEQMRAYALEAVRADREAFAAKWEAAHGFDKFGFAAAIRAQGSKT